MHKIVLADCIRKVSVCGKAQCCECLDLINYASRGVNTLIRHCQTKKHIRGLTTKLTNYQISANQSAPSTSTATYGISPQLTVSAKRKENYKPIDGHTLAQSLCRCVTASLILRFEKGRLKMGEGVHGVHFLQNLKKKCSKNCKRYSFVLRLFLFQSKYRGKRKKR